MKKPSRYEPAKRSLGQNFLIDPFFQKKIASDVLAFQKDHLVIEIGPGRGAITQHLTHHTKKLLLIEKDDALAKDWQQELAAKPHCTVWHGDALEWDTNSIGEEKALVVGNLPYNVATPILLKFLKAKPTFTRLTFMLQKEVAQKCMAEPGHKNYGPLSVTCQLLSDMEKICDVPPQAFKPQPNVDSRVLSFSPKSVDPNLDVEKFLHFVQVAFSQRRKMLRGVLPKFGMDVQEFEHKENFMQRRAESLSGEEWLTLFSQVLKTNTK